MVGQAVSVVVGDKQVGQHGVVLVSALAWGAEHVYYIVPVVKSFAFDVLHGAGNTFFSVEVEGADESVVTVYAGVDGVCVTPVFAYHVCECAPALALCSAMVGEVLYGLAYFAPVVVSVLYDLVCLVEAPSVDVVVVYPPGGHFAKVRQGGGVGDIARGYGVAHVGAGCAVYGVSRG